MSLESILSRFGRGISKAVLGGVMYASSMFGGCDSFDGMKGKDAADAGINAHCEIYPKFSGNILKIEDFSCKEIDDSTLIEDIGNNVGFEFLKVKHYDLTVEKDIFDAIVYPLIDGKRFTPHPSRIRIAKRELDPKWTGDFVNFFGGGITYSDNDSELVFYFSEALPTVNSASQLYNHCFKKVDETYKDFPESNAAKLERISCLRYSPISPLEKETVISNSNLILLGQEEIKEELIKYFEDAKSCYRNVNEIMGSGFVFGKIPLRLLNIDYNYFLSSPDTGIIIPFKNSYKGQKFSPKGVCNNDSLAHEFVHQWFGREAFKNVLSESIAAYVQNKIRKLTAVELKEWEVSISKKPKTILESNLYVKVNSINLDDLAILVEVGYIGGDNELIKLDEYELEKDKAVEIDGTDPLIISLNNSSIVKSEDVDSPNNLVLIDLYKYAIPLQNYVSKKVICDEDGFRNYMGWVIINSSSVISIGNSQNTKYPFVKLSDYLTEKYDPHDFESYYNSGLCLIDEIVKRGCDFSEMVSNLRRYSGNLENKPADIHLALKSCLSEEDLLFLSQKYGIDIDSLGKQPFNNYMTSDSFGLFK